MSFIPKVIIIREDLFALAGQCYTEALLLHRMLMGDFKELNPYRMEDFHYDLLLGDNKSSKPKKALTRLIDKRYVEKVYSMEAKMQMNKYQILIENINRDLLRLGYPPYEQTITRYADYICRTLSASNRDC